MKVGSSTHKLHSTLNDLDTITHYQKITLIAAKKEMTGHGRITDPGS